jgi:hypothetical protein
MVALTGEWLLANRWILIRITIQRYYKKRDIIMCPKWRRISNKEMSIDPTMDHQSKPQDNFQIHCADFEACKALWSTEMKGSAECGNNVK